MNIQQLCDYLNEIGIIDIDNIKHFLEITTYMINNNIQNESNKSTNDIYKISLFSYIREINEDDKNLFFTCSNIINSFKRFNYIKNSPLKVTIQINTTKAKKGNQRINPLL